MKKISSECIILCHCTDFINNVLFFFNWDGEAEVVVAPYKESFKSRSSQMEKEEKITLTPL